MGAAGGHQLAPQVGVGQNAIAIREPHQYARDVGLGHHPGCLAGARGGFAEHGRAVDQRTQVGRADVRLRVGDVPGSDHPLAQ